jgi:hypothetical protein
MGCVLGAASLEADTLNFAKSKSFALVLALLLDDGVGVVDDGVGALDGGAVFDDEGYRAEGPRTPGVGSLLVTREEEESSCEVESSDVPCEGLSSGTRLNMPPPGGSGMGGVVVPSRLLPSCCPCCPPP